ncbi:hypothetical protein BGX28_003619 [Mortierella sp. GBA30]|nr:hypothetical protein BGX28_003619 [Mortierella sp. GBA30]
MPPTPRLKPAERPKVLVVGAGIAGLTLAILLDKAKVPYDIYERSAEVRRLAPLFKQIGIYEEFVSKSKPCKSIDVFDERRESSFVLDFSPVREMSGFEGYIIPRHALYELLLKQVPPERIHRGKRVLSMMQNENGVMIRFSDGTSADGDILVGADGAHSAVRQSLYKQIQKVGKLPSTDSEALPYSCVCLAANSSTLDIEKFPELKDPMCRFNNIVAQDRPYSWLTWTASNSTMCWGVIQYLDKESSKENDGFRNSEWGTEATETMCNDVRGFPIPGGDGALTLGDLIDNTPKDQITKAVLEEKVFDTWYHGRTVLIGDACHKIHPAGGQGALLAFHDAIALANWINVLPSTSLQDIEMIFKEYRQERLPPAQASYANGQMMASISARSIKSIIFRRLCKVMPSWCWRLLHRKYAANRPQVAFLPLVQDTGSVKPTYQVSLHKTLELLEADKIGGVESALDIPATV